MGEKIEGSNSSCLLESLQVTLAVTLEHDTCFNLHFEHLDNPLNLYTKPIL
jgi:hypothetical protein